MLLSCVGPSSFPGQRAESHNHKLYHVGIAAPAEVHHVLFTARGEDPRDSRAVLQALCTDPSFEHTALAHGAILRNKRKIDGVWKMRDRYHALIQERAKTPYL